MMMMIIIIITIKTQVTPVIIGEFEVFHPEVLPLALKIERVSH